MTDTITTDFTTDEILEALEDHLENGDGWDEFTTYVADGFIDEKGDKRYFRPYVTVTLRGTEYQAKKVATTGGMDEGSALSITIQVGSQFFRKHGYYASHYGSDWDGDFREVKAVTKTVTVFE